MIKKGVGVALLVAGLGAVACSGDRAPDGLRMTPPGSGPVVEWDLTHRPLPQVPIPNDIATFPDPTSRTGVRINASLVAPTNIETVARGAFDEMEGWGTSAPISVQFQRAQATPNGEAEIDLDDVKARMGGHDYDMTDDPVYVVNLTTGVPAILDMGNGNFPATMRDLDRLWPNDPHYDVARGRVSQNLLFETLEEGKGLGQSDYTPALDLDFDGVIDHPNTLGTASRPDLDGVENLLTWYERETDTMIMRPLLPLLEKTEYAVILTDRLKGHNGQPVRSPFAAIHHPLQRPGIAKLQALLADKTRKNYYGDIAGTGLDHVAFAWTFTTQPTQEDMKLLRDGLYGKGPFSYFADRYPPKVTLFKAAGLALDPASEPPEVATNPACQRRMKTPYIVKVNDDDIAPAIKTYYEQVVGTAKGETAWAVAANQHIDHVVIGTFDTPYLEGDPTDTNPQEARFHVNFKTGEGNVYTDKVHFWLIVPKTTAKAKPPFDITFWQHGVTGDDSETMIYAGALAAQGIATIGIDMPEHGLAYGAGDFATAQTALRPPCLVEWVNATGTGRSRQFNGDGKNHSGWFWWTSHVFHVRDNVRQGLLDMMNAVRILKSFDGKARADQDYNSDGTNDLAGDFDGDGAVDVGGPNAKYFSAGESLGGMMTEGIGGVEPSLTATTPMSGGAGMSDIAVRSYGVTEAVWEQVVGPLVTSTPASAHPPKGDGTKQTSCAMDRRSIRMHLNDGDDDVDVEIACLTAAEVDAGMTVVVENVRSKEKRCARTDAGGTFRVPFPASIGDKIDVQLYTKPDVVVSYKGCELTADAVPGRRINTFEVPGPPSLTKAVGDDTKVCPTPDVGCSQFRDQFFSVGSPLVAPNEGYGDGRNTPELRRLFMLVQAALDPADNFNFAPYYMIRPLYDENGVAAPPRALLSINTVGDMFVPVSTGTAFARAAGAVPFLPPTAAATMPEYADYATPPELWAELGQKTPNQILIENHAIVGIARFKYTAAGPSCKTNYVPVGTLPATCDRMQSPLATCSEALWDADWLSEGHQGFDQPHAQVALRLARFADAHVTDAASLSQAWQPRILGKPDAPDGAWTPSRKIVGMMNNYIKPDGNHTWDIGDVCRAWDQAGYGDAIIARFFATAGTDVYYLSHPQSHATCLVGTPGNPFDPACAVFQ